MAGQFRTLDVNRVYRAGCLDAGAGGEWSWSEDGNETARISYSAQRGAITLSYKVREYGGDWESITQRVRISYSGCHYGGQRPYFICPGVVNGRACHRRVVKLYGASRYFLCRHCYRLRYGSQSEDRCQRLLRRANKLRMALGGEPGTAYLIAPKPKGMWQRTYQAMCVEIYRCEDQADQLFLSKYSSLLSTDERALFFDS